MIITVRLFAAARQAAGRGTDEFELPEGTTLRGALAAATGRYGGEFPDVLATARVWINGDEPPHGPETPVREGDEIAVLPPVSGGR